MSPSDICIFATPSGIHLCVVEAVSTTETLENGVPKTAVQCRVAIPIQDGQVYRTRLAGADLHEVFLEHEPTYSKVLGCLRRSPAWQWVQDYSRHMHDIPPPADLAPIQTQDCDPAPPAPVQASQPVTTVDNF